MVEGVEVLFKMWFLFAGAEDRYWCLNRWGAAADMIQTTSCATANNNKVEPQYPFGLHSDLGNVASPLANRVSSHFVMSYAENYAHLIGWNRFLIFVLDPPIFRQFAPREVCQAGVRWARRGLGRSGCHRCCILLAAVALQEQGERLRHLHWCPVSRTTHSIRRRRCLARATAATTRPSMISRPKLMHSRSPSDRYNYICFR